MSVTLNEFDEEEICLSFIPDKYPTLHVILRE